MKGRKPKPRSLKLMAGNPGKRPIRDDEPDPALAIPPCPDYISDAAKDEWRRMAARLYDLGLLTEIDGPALAMYCTAWARWVRAEGMVEEKGELLVTKKKNLIQNPYRAVANKAFDQMYKMLVEFGLTPSARSRVKVDKKVAHGDSKARFFQ